MYPIGKYLNTVYLNDILHNSFNNKKLLISGKTKQFSIRPHILPIDILDLFPMLKKRISTLEIMFYLQKIENKNIVFSVINKWNERNSTWTNITNHEEILQIREEELVIRQLIELIENLDIIDLDLSTCTIYDLIGLARLFKNGIQPSRNFNNKHHDNFINAVLEHPKIDPLYASILYGNYNLVHKYINDIRNNKINAYKLASKENFYISKIIKDELIIKIFLLKKILFSKNLPHDIFQYIILSGIY